MKKVILIGLIRDVDAMMQKMVAILVTVACRI